MTFPLDFPVPQDSGGPGAGRPLGGFGGNPSVDGTAHRAAVTRVGKSPVLLLHGNAGAADARPWDLLDQREFLRGAGYPDEIIWAPSYLGAGSVDLQTPHTNNVDDVRDFLDAVCTYLDVDVVDVIAHSLGCTLMYAVCRGLNRQTAPITFDQPPRWNRIGTFVGLSGAFHGLGAGSIGEWATGGPFMTGLLAETAGGGGETPFGPGDVPTDPPVPHQISYFCGVAAGDFVDAQNPGTGRLAGADNRSYNLGSGQAGHQAIKESQVVFNDFLPLLNSVPPVPAVTLQLDKLSGPYPAPLTVTVSVDPGDVVVELQADQIRQDFVNGYIVATVVDTRSATLTDGQSLVIDQPGYWPLTATAAAGADPLVRRYWVDVDEIVVTIATDNTEPFDESLLVVANSSEPTATVYNSLDGANWTVGPTVTISQDSVVYFVGIDANGIGSEVVSRSFVKRVRWADAVTASAIDHFVAGRIGVTEYLDYSAQFGYFAPFTLYLVDGEWVLDPQAAGVGPTRRGAAAEEPVPAVTERGSLVAVTADPAPGTYPAGPLRITLTSGPAMVYYTLDGSPPGPESARFDGTETVELPASERAVITCRTSDDLGRRNYQTLLYLRE